MQIPCHLELKVFTVNPLSLQEAITIHTLSREDVKVNNSGSVGMPPLSLTSLYGATDCARCHPHSHLLTVCWRALILACYVWSSSTPSEFQKVTANAPESGTVAFTLWESSISNPDFSCMPFMPSITEHGWVCLLLDEAKFVGKCKKTRG